MSMSPSPAIVLVLALSMSACAITSPGERGSLCGGTQFAQSRAVLPDTGINAGSQVSVSFIEHYGDGGTNELSEVAIQHLWPTGQASDPESDPRVRLVRDDGRVLLDTLGTRQGSGGPDRPTWIVFTWLRSAELRNSYFDGFTNEAVWLELWRQNATQPGTRVRLRTESVGVSPVVRCL